MKLYYEVKMKIMIDVDDGTDSSAPDQLLDRLESLANIEDGTVSVLDVDLTLYDVK